ncbi:MAG: ATP-dependent DNA helicase, partial [Ruthenibacterium lactatiformans]
MSQTDEFTRADIEAFALQKQLCPFELALDLTNWCDCIVCDYNYLFDPVVSLKRFFTEGGDFIFLIDEAHNLVDRARDMYSAQLLKSAVYGVKKALGKGHRKLTAALNKVNSEMIELRRRCEEADEHRLVIPEGLPELNKLLSRLSAACEDWLEEHRDGELHAEVLALYFEVHFYLRIAELYDTNYTTLLAAFGSEVCVRLLCLDAAPFLDASMALGRASILFSATLSPAEYFIQTLGGGPAAKAIRLQSPFSQERLCLAAAGISTKYTDRERTRESVCRLIGAAVSAHAGNYIVFLPSYKYMQDVSDEFAMMYPDVPLTVQENGMDEDAREAFLAQFSADRPGTLVGFCVLGGIFAEGIDLAGDRLIGSIIVGVGLPQIGVEQNALRDYYEDTMGMGFEYAY